MPEREGRLARETAVPLDEAGPAVIELLQDAPDRPEGFASEMSVEPVMTSSQTERVERR